MGVDEMDPAQAVAETSVRMTTSTVDDRAVALETLYAVHCAPVYRYLRTLSGSDEDAADLTATTFEHAFGAIDRLRPDGSPLAWLLRIARNAAIDHARRRRPATSLDDLREADEPSAVGTPEDSYLDAERVQQVRDLVRALPEAQREAIALRYAAGLTAKEISHVIGKSPAASQKLIERALVALREARDVER